jgi:hypothetical protein
MTKVERKPPPVVAGNKKNPNILGPEKFRPFFSVIPQVKCRFREAEGTI